MEKTTELIIPIHTWLPKASNNTKLNRLGNIFFAIEHKRQKSSKDKNMN